MGKWTLIALPWAVIVLVGGYFLLNACFAPKKEKQMTHESIEQQIKALGPMSRDEKITSVVLLITLGLWMVERTLGISSAITAILALSVLLALDVMKPIDFRQKITWDPAIFIGCAMSLGTVLAKVGVSEWLQTVLGEVITPVLANPFIAVVALSVIIYLAKFALVSLITCATVFLLVLTPFFATLSYNPLVLVFIVATSINVWLLPYMNPPYLTTSAAVDSSMAGNKEAAISSLIYMILNIIALLISIPYWQLIGLI